MCARSFRRRGGIPTAALLVSVLAAGCGSGGSISAGPNDRQLFIRSAVENADRTLVTLPIYQGTSQGQTVWYLITDSSNRADAQARGVNFAPKLANAVGTAAVQVVTVSNGVIDFPATVDFAQQRVLTAGTPPFPPAQATPGSTGQSGYSPLIQMPDGTVLNASHVANASGRADKAVVLDTAARTVTWRETIGFFAHRVVHYISVDATAAVPATLEDVTLAPALGDAPAVGDESAASARETIVAFTNGQIGADNPERQGLSSAIVDGLNPLNVVDDVPPTADGPGSTAYSPLWDVSLAQWSPAAISTGQNTRQRSVAAVRALAAQGLITSPSGGAVGGSGPIANCPVISVEALL
jgi:hypothetical protein